MEHSIFLAKLFGVLYLVVSIGILTNAKHYAKLMKHITEDIGLLYLGGAMALTAGMLVAHFHPVWVAGWQTIITIIGWLALVKGVAILIAPNAIRSCAKFWEKRMRFAGAISLILGLVLCYYGFVVG